MMWISASNFSYRMYRILRYSNIYRTRSAFYATTDEEGSRCNIVKGNALRLLWVTEGIDDFLNASRNVSGSLEGLQLSIDSGSISLDSQTIWFLGRFRLHCLGHCTLKSV